MLKTLSIRHKLIKNWVLLELNSQAEKPLLKTIRLRRNHDELVALVLEILNQKYIV